jgi:hypothetical protein
VSVWLPSARAAQHRWQANKKYGEIPAAKLPQSSAEPCGNSHSSLGYQTPKEFATAMRAAEAGCALPASPSSAANQVVQARAVTVQISPHPLNWRSSFPEASGEIESSQGSQARQLVGQSHRKCIQFAVSPRDSEGGEPLPRSLGRYRLWHAAAQIPDE